MPKKTVVSGPPFVSPHGYGTCFCGCGEKAPIAKKSDKHKGHVIGYPMKFVPGHQKRKYIPGYEENPETGCWDWTGALTQEGYARTGARQMMHRAYFEQEHGEIPIGMQVHHKCFNRKCVNPDHLELTTPAQNTRASAKVLDWDKVREIRRRLEDDEVTAVEIARDMGIKVALVRDVGNYVRWREPIKCPCCAHEFEPWQYKRRKTGRRPAK